MKYIIFSFILFLLLWLFCALKLSHDCEIEEEYKKEEI